MSGRSDIEILANMERLVRELQGHGEEQVLLPEDFDMEAVTWEIFHDYQDRLVFSDLDFALILDLQEFRNKDPLEYMKKFVGFYMTVAGEGFPNNIEEGADAGYPEEMYVVRFLTAIDEERIHGDNYFLVSPGDPMMEEARFQFNRQDFSRFPIHPDVGHIMHWDWFFSREYGYRGSWHFQGSPREDYDDGYEFRDIEYLTARIIAGVENGSVVVFKLATPVLPERASKLFETAISEIANKSELSNSAKRRRGRSRKRS